MSKPIAEFFGTFALVFLGCGSAVIAGAEIGYLGISLAFGLTVAGMAYGIGPISGCHINPAVSLGALVSGRMTKEDFISYVIAQCAGAVLAALVLYLIASGKVSGDATAKGLGQNGWSDYSFMSAFLFEVVATFLFVMVIFGSTGKAAPTAMAGLAIGLTLVVIHLVGIPITGTSVNPARSLGPALFSGGTAMAQLPVFIIAPCIGAVAAGLLIKSGILGDDDAGA